MADAKRRLLPSQSQFFFYGILFLTFLLTWRIVQPFVIVIVTGIFVAVLALPIDKFWERTWSRITKRKGLGNRIAAFCTMLSLFLLISAPLVGLGFALAGDARSAIDAVNDGAIEKSLDTVLDIVLPNQNATERNATLAQIWDEIEPRVQSFLAGLAGQVVGWVGRIFIGVTVILFVTYYVLTDGDRLIQYLRRAAPLPAKQVDFLLAEAHNGLKAVFFGQILTSLIQGALGGIGFLIAGVQGVVIWSAVMAILSLLPVIGPPVVWLPAAIILLTQGNIWQGIFLLIWGGVVVTQSDNFIRPKLIGDRADIHPLFVLLGVLGGVAAFGFIGLFLGPMMVGLAVSILKVWESDYLDPTLQVPDQGDG